MDYSQLATKGQIEHAMQSLEANGMQAFFVETGGEAKAKVLEILPAGVEVMNMTSVTLDTIGVVKEILDSSKYKPVRAKFADKATTPSEKRKLGGGPDWTVGSVHALTEDGKLLIASNTGSQLGAYAYGAEHLIWVIGAQKIVKDLDEAMKRIYEYVLPLERARAKKAYGEEVTSNVSKLLIINKEVAKDRISVIIVNEVLGF